MICIKCGTESKLYRNLCSNCFKKTYSFSSVPELINISICPSCNARLKSKHWEDSSSFVSAVKDSISDLVKIENDISDSFLDIKTEILDSHNIKAIIDCRINFDDLEFSENHHAKARIKYEQCDVCSKMAASYYTAIIQIRGDKRELMEEEVNRCFDIVEDAIGKIQNEDKSTFVSKIEKPRGGYDIYLSDQNTAKNIARLLHSNFGGTMTTSSSLVGQKDGKETYRMTYLVRFPSYRDGDIIDFDRNIFFILKVTNKKIDLFDLKNWLKSNITVKKMKDFKIIGNKNDFKKGQVISESKSEFQLLDLENYKTYDIVKPERFSDFEELADKEDDTKEIFFIIIDDDIYIIPTIF